MEADIENIIDYTRKIHPIENADIIILTNATAIDKNNKNSTNTIHKFNSTWLLRVVIFKL